MLATALGLSGLERAAFEDAARGRPDTLSTRPRPAVLPAQPTPFIGREPEVATVMGLLLQPEARLLTLTGPGGVGKTRLALRVAEEAAGQFADGAYVVGLAPVADPALVAAAIATALGVEAPAGRLLADRLGEYLREKRALLVLDNVEHLRGAGNVVAELLTAAPLLTVLATGRAPFRLAAEREYSVPALRLPDLEPLPAPEPLARCESVRLFVERARAIRPDFQVADEDARAVAEICHRLDGLPLAIELAAAWVRLFDPPALLARLGGRLALLTGGPRDRPPRQRTLRAMIDWSYRLLGGRERRLFGRLAVFVGGWSMEAAEAVCGGAGGVDVLAGLSALAEQSLLRRAEGAGGEARFGMLETIREYAAEKLAAGGEGTAPRRRHAVYYLGLAREAERELHGLRQAAWLDRLETEHDNLRAAVAWALDAGEAEVALGLAAALHWFWYVRGHATEGRGLLARALEAHAGVEGAGGRGEEAPSLLVAAALYAAGHLALFQGDYAAARPLLRESAAAYRSLDDGPALVDALVFLGMAANHLGDGAGARAAVEEIAALSPTLTGRRARALLWRGDAAASRPALEESLGLFRALEDAWFIAQVLTDLGLIALGGGDRLEARARHEEGVALARALGDRALLAAALNSLGEVARCAGDDAEAAALYGESLELFRKLGNRQDVPRLLHNLGYVALRGHDLARSEALFRRSLELFQEIGLERGIAEGLAGLAAVSAVRACTRTEAARAARLWGAAERWRAGSGAPWWPADRVERDRYLPVARALVDEATFAAAWAEGEALTLEQAVAEARTGGMTSSRSQANVAPSERSV